MEKRSLLLRVCRARFLEVFSNPSIRPLLKTKKSKRLALTLLSECDRKREHVRKESTKNRGRPMLNFKLRWMKEKDCKMTRFGKSKLKLIEKRQKLKCK